MPAHPTGHVSARILGRIRVRLSVHPGAVMKFVENPQASAQPLLLLLLLFLAQLPLICESQTEAPCTVLTQNRNRVHIINSPRLAPHALFVLWTCRFTPVSPVACVMEVFIHQRSVASLFSIAAACYHIARFANTPFFALTHRFSVITHINIVSGDYFYFF